MPDGSSADGSSFYLRLTQVPENVYNIVPLAVALTGSPHPACKTCERVLNTVAGRPLKTINNP
jgi:hypothetical protein